MKINKREKYLLGILLTVAVCFSYYKFVYVYESEKLSKERAEENKLEDRYNEVVRNISKLASKEEDLKKLNENIVDNSKKLYPTIIQEKIIVELDKLLKDSNLKGNIAFTPKEVSEVEKIVRPEFKKDESSLQPMVDEYNGNKTSNASTNNTTGSKDGNSKVEKSGATAEQLKVAINFTGSYENLKKFITAVGNYDRRIVITNTSIVAKSPTELSGVMSLEFYGIPKLPDTDQEYLEWTLKSVYGKDILFSSAAASGAYSNMVKNQNEVASDFEMMLKPTVSELPTLSITKSKDDSKESYIYEDSDKIESVEISFTEEAGKLYYKYKTSGSAYPKDDSSKGKEFTPNSDNIVLDILSEKRFDGSDNSGAKITINNKTSKKVEVVVEKDDTSRPRVELVSEGNVNVTKK